MGPSKSADAKAPIKIAICWLRGVEKRVADVLSHLLERVAH